MRFWTELDEDWNSVRDYTVAEENRLAERGILLLGILVGLALSCAAIHWGPASESGLREAREVGLISRTVLFCYDKTQEFKFYLLTIFLTGGTALWMWLFWGWRGSRRATEVQRENPPTADLSSQITAASFLRRPVPAALLLAFLLVLYYSPRFFLRTAYFFHFFFEEGHYYGALQEMLRGHLLYRDVFFIYGPLSVYPAYWLMRLFGPHVEWLRVQTFSFDVIAIVLVYYFLRRFTRRPLTPFVGTLLFIVLYFPDWAAPSGGVFRYFSGIIPLMILSRYFRTRQIKWLVIIGLSIGGVLFYSQEVGLCAFIATLMAMVGEGFEAGFSRWKKTLGRAFIIALSTLVTFGLGFVFFAFRGGGAAFWEVVWKYPHEVGLGYFGLPYPNLLQSTFNLLHHPDHQTLRIWLWVMEGYLPILLYLVLAVVYLVRFLKRQLGSDGVVWAGVVIYGMALFRTALARSNYLKLNWCLVPALLVLLKGMDELWCSLGQDRRSTTRLSRLMRYGNAALIVVLTSILCGYYGTVGRDALTIFTVENTYKMDRLLGRHVPAFDPFQYRRLTEPRTAGVAVPQDWFSGIEQTARFFREETDSNEKVLAFPSAPTFNFLLDRSAPTRFRTPYLAVTRAARREMVRELDASGTRFIIYERLSWRIDNLTDIVHFPELAYYIDTHYRLYRDFGSVKILIRLPAPQEKTALVDF
ncbi:MAG: hypothetical protein PHX83_08140 [Acidobacteriia bacterium]|nr:hypothetical protein [Terriglobia bacterium]